MSQEIINVLNYLGEQLGIAIDWTSENVWPQVMSILGRYRLFELVLTGFWLFVEIIMFIGVILMFKKIIKDYMRIKTTKEDNFWWHKTYYSQELTGFGWILFIICISLGIFSIVSIPVDINNWLKWFIIPEVKYMEMLKGLMG